MKNKSILVAMTTVPLGALPSCAGADTNDGSDGVPTVSAEAPLVVDAAAATLLSTVVDTQPGNAATPEQRLATPATVSGLDVRFVGCGAVVTQVEVAATAGGARTALIPRGQGVFAAPDDEPVPVSALTVYYRATTAEACALVVKRAGDAGGGGGPGPQPGSSSSLLLLTRFDIPASSPAKSAFVAVVDPQPASSLRVRVYGCWANVAAVDILPVARGPVSPIPLAPNGESTWGVPGAAKVPVGAVAIAFASPVRTQCGVSVENASPGAAPLPGVPVLQVLLAVGPGQIQTGLLSAQNPILTKDLLVDLRDCDGALPTGLDVGANVTSVRRLQAAGGGRYVTPDGATTPANLLNLFLSSRVSRTCKLAMYKPG